MVNCYRKMAWLVAVTTGAAGFKLHPRKAGDESSTTFKAETIQWLPSARGEDLRNLLQDFQLEWAVSDNGADVVTAQTTAELIEIVLDSKNADEYSASVLALAGESRKPKETWTNLREALETARGQLQGLCELHRDAAQLPDLLSRVDLLAQILETADADSEKKTVADSEKKTKTWVELQARARAALQKMRPARDAENDNKPTEEEVVSEKEESSEESSTEDSSSVHQEMWWQDAFLYVLAFGCWAVAFCTLFGVFDDNYGVFRC